METIKNYLETMFSTLPNTYEVQKAKKELAQMMEDKYTELINDGKTDNEAVGIVISEFGNLDELAEDLGIKVEQRQIAEEELETFEEAGACGTAAVISPISRIDDIETGKSYVFGEKPGPVSEKLFNLLRGIQNGIEPDTHNWTRVVIE